MPAIPGKLCDPITFKNLMTFTEGADLPATATNDKGESVIVGKEHYGEQLTNYCFRLDTYQKNGWIRTNRYYPGRLRDESYELGR